MRPPRAGPDRLSLTVATAQGSRSATSIRPPSISVVHLRRALLLFAIVLGLAAIAASLSRPNEAERDATPVSPPAAREPTVSPGTAAQPPVTLRLHADRDQTRRLEIGRAATLEVAVDEPGQVEIPVLGLAAPATPLTPARFEVLPSEVRRYPIEFTPADSDNSRPAGTLDVIAADR
jgi:hypothetical protein